MTVTESCYELVRQVIKYNELVGKYLRLHVPTLEVHWHTNPNVPWCAFHPPTKLMVCTLGIERRTKDEIVKAVIDNVTSAGLHWDYLKQRADYREARIPGRLPKPVLQGFKSPHWHSLRIKLAATTPRY